MAVVLFAHLEEAVMLLGAVERNKAVGEFTFIASDGVGNFGRQGLEKVEHAAMGECCKIILYFFFCISHFVFLRIRFYEKFAVTPYENLF